MMIKAISVFTPHDPKRDGPPLRMSEIAELEKRFDDFKRNKAKPEHPMCIGCGSRAPRLPDGSLPCGH